MHKQSAEEPPPLAPAEEELLSIQNQQIKLSAPGGAFDLAFARL